MKHKLGIGEAINVGQTETESQQHTPGPWSHPGEGNYVDWNPDYHPDIMRYRYSIRVDAEAPYEEIEVGRQETQSVATAWGRTPEEALANARLIAAAPDLLQLAEYTLNHFAATDSPHPNQIKAREVQLAKAAMTAIKKATQ